MQVKIFEEDEMVGFLKVTQQEFARLRNGHWIERAYQLSETILAHGSSHIKSTVTYERVIFKAANHYRKGRSPELVIICITGDWRKLNKTSPKILEDLKELTQ